MDRQDKLFKSKTTKKVTLPKAVVINPKKEQKKTDLIQKSREENMKNVLLQIKKRKDQEKDKPIEIKKRFNISEEDKKIRNYLYNIKDDDEDEIIYKIEKHFIDNDEIDTVTKDIFIKINKSLGRKYIKKFINEYLYGLDNFFNFYKFYLKQYNENPGFFEENEKIKSLFQSLKIEINNSDFPGVLEKLQKFRDAPDTNPERIEIFNKIIELDFYLIKKLVRTYLDQYFDDYDKFGKIVKKQLIRLFK